MFHEPSRWGCAGATKYGNIRTVESTKKKQNGVLTGWTVDRRKEGLQLSIMIDLPPAMAQEAREFAIIHGTTLEQMLFEYIKTELARRAKADKAMSKLDELVRQGHGRLSEPYKFKRADAYEPEVPYS